ncbi:MAG: hypothetical protein R3F54_23440 [Alphaproteobacteria bacterium]
MWISIGVLTFIVVGMIVGIFKGRGISFMDPKEASLGGPGFVWPFSVSPEDARDKRDHIFREIERHLENEDQRASDDAARRLWESHNDAFR